MNTCFSDDFSFNLYLIIKLINIFFCNGFYFQQINAVASRFFLILHHVAVDILESVAITNNFICALLNNFTILHNKHFINVL